MFLFQIVSSKLRAFRSAALLSCFVCALLCSNITAYCQSELRTNKREAMPPALLLGAAWYPEQWPESRWNADLDLMQKAHMHVVRVGEFAWTALEPAEGKYELDWLERAVNLAGRHGIYVVLGTPSAGPPVWMATKYPDILITEANGKQFTGATRNRSNWNSDRYKRFVREMDEQLSKRFGHNPYVIGWQIGNEYRANPTTQTPKHSSTPGCRAATVASTN